MGHMMFDCPPPHGELKIRNKLLTSKPGIELHLLTPVFELHMHRIHTFTLELYKRSWNYGYISYRVMVYNYSHEKGGGYFLNLHNA